MPIVSAWVMPMGILGVVAMPGFDAECWRLMGYGIEWMDDVALWVANLPGAYGRVTAFGSGPLLLMTAGLLVMGLLKPPLRWSGALFLMLATVWAARVPLPDVLVAGDGRTFAVAAPTAGSRSTTPAATLLRRRSGSRPTPTAATSMIAASGRASPAMHRAVSASCLMAR